MRHPQQEATPNLEIASGLWQVVTPLLAGLAIGFTVLLVLRWRGLRWTWALPGLPLAYLLATVGLWGPAFACGIASLLTAGLGAYWQGQDHYRGGEDARRAREAVGPVNALRSWRSRRRAPEQRVEPAKKSIVTRRRTGPQIALGTTPRGAPVSVPLGISRGVHALVIGATGAGKTFTQAGVAQTHVLTGLPVITFDPKNDRFLRETLRLAAERMGVPFRCWSLSGSATYNPFARGGPTEVTDKALYADLCVMPT